MHTLTGLSLFLVALNMQPLPQEAVTSDAEPAREASPSSVQTVDQTSLPTPDSPSLDENSVPKQSPELLAFADKSDDDLVVMAKSWLENVETLNGNFIQQAPSGTVSSGVFYLRRPGLLRFEYKPPSDLLIVANGGTVFVRDEALKTTDSYPVARTPLKFLLRRKIDFDVAQIVGVDRGPDAFSIAISARDEETEGELNLVFSAPEGELIRWVVRDVRDGLTIVDLFDVKKDERLNNNLFRIPETQSPFLKN